MYRCRNCGFELRAVGPGITICLHSDEGYHAFDLVPPHPEEDVAEKATTVAENATPLDEQVGGSHYKDCAIQPAEFVHANKVPYLEGSIIYYVFRWRNKNGIEDLKKARHTIDLLIQLEESKGGGK